MRFSRRFAWACWGAAIAVLGLVTPAFAQSRPAPRPATAVIDATHPIMQVEEVAQTGDTTVFGDASKPGTFVVRKKIAANQTVRPHYDDQDQWVTVLKGTLWLGKGDTFRPDKLLPIREGGVAYLPANTHYFEMSGEADVMLQITGTGPVKSVPTEVDAKGQPVPEGGPYPVFAAGPRKNMPVDPDLLTPEQVEQMERAAAARKEAAAKQKAADPAASAPKK
jgi:quercetin dioxygenase-like cupin family protein